VTGPFAAFSIEPLAHPDPGSLDLKKQPVIGSLRFARDEVLVCGMDEQSNELPDIQVTLKSWHTTARGMR
jgi:hypothetical protein